MQFRIIKGFIKEAGVIPILLCLFFVPLAFAPFFIHSFAQGKELFFKIVILATLCFTFFLIIKRKSVEILPVASSSICVLVILSFFTNVITGIFSPTPLAALYGSYSRGFGLITQTFLFAWILYCAHVLNKKNIYKLLHWIFISGLLVGLYAILQKAGFDLLFSNFEKNLFVGRVFSFLGNPGYLGQFMLLQLILGLYLLFFSQNLRNKFLYGAGLAVIFAALVFSQTRTALFGLVLCCVLFALRFRLNIITAIRKIKWKYAAIAVIGLLTAIVLLFQSVPKERFSLSSISLRSLQSRFEIWKGVINLIEKRPLAGYGTESFYIYFPETINKHFLTLEEDINISADRIHNEFLEIVFSSGVIGGLLYILFLAILLKIFFTDKKPLAILFSFLILANVIQNQLAFSDITINIFMGFCIGGLIALHLKDKGKITIRLKNIMCSIMAFAAIIIAAFFFYIAIYKPFMSHRAYTVARQNDSVNYEIAVNMHKKAAEYTPFYSELWYELMFIDPSSMERALYNLERIEGNSGNVLAWKGNYYAFDDAQKASKFYKQALNKNPYHPNWIRAFAEMLYKHGDYENALFLYEKYLDAAPDFWKWKDNLSQHSAEEVRSYEVFFKHTPYFWKIVERVEELKNKLGKH